MEAIDLSQTKPIKLLWLSPNLNHYKARLINRLHETTDVDVTVVAGTGRKKGGDKSLERKWEFSLVQTQASKAKFGLSLSVMKLIFSKRKEFDWLLVPKESKYILLIFFCWLLKNISRAKNFKLVSYNHPVYLSGARKDTLVKKYFSKALYSLYDRVVFYTETARNDMVSAGLIKAEKAFFANNTVDTEEIRVQYDFEVPEINPTILFIGRLIPSKKLSVCIDYYKQLCLDIPELNLIVIGDGPDAKLISDLSKSDIKVTWTGALVEESEIARYMKKCWLVLVPGASGLSVNHALAYGRPYATCKNALHGPELSYIEHERNGFILSGNLSSDVSRLKQFFTSSETTFFNNAWDAGTNLSISQWCTQFQRSLTPEVDVD